MIEVGEIVNDPDFAVAGITRLRAAVSLAYEGEVQTSYTSTPITGSLQPAKQSDVLSQESGTRINNLIVLFTQDDVREGDGANVVQDILVYEGKNYRVTAVEHWEDGGFIRVVASNYVKGGS